MGRVTLSKLARRFDVVERIDMVDGVPVERKEVVERAKILPAQARFQKKCLECGLPMMVAPGQIQHVHGACRKKARHG